MKTDLYRVVTNILEDIRLYLLQIDDTLYSQKLTMLSGSSIGMHTRHILEFYQCLIEGSTNLVNYDKRRRDIRIEEDSKFALKTIKNVLETISTIDPNTKLTLEVSYDLTPGNYSRVETNFTRELVYNLEHTIHHLALIRIGLMEVASGIILPEHFGVAPSTIKYQNYVKGYLSI